MLTDAMQCPHIFECTQGMPGAPFARCGSDVFPGGMHQPFTAVPYEMDGSYGSYVNCNIPPDYSGWANPVSGLPST